MLHISTPPAMPTQVLIQTLRGSYAFLRAINYVQVSDRYQVNQTRSHKTCSLQKDHHHIHVAHVQQQSGQFEPDIGGV